MTQLGHFYPIVVEIYPAVVMPARFDALLYGGLGENLFLVYARFSLRWNRGGQAPALQRRGSGEFAEDRPPRYRSTEEAELL